MIGKSAKHLILPRTEPVRRAIEPRFRPRVVYARAASGSGKSSSDKAVIVLVVEDDYLVASEMELALTEAGFNVAAVVASAEEALKAAGSQPIDIAVMDIRLAGEKDGVDAAVALFKTHGIRSVFATAHSDGDTMARASAAKPLGWLQKPFTMPSLVETVRHALHGRNERH